MLGAQTEGMIGYLIQQELGNELPMEQRIASLLTLIEVDRDDPALGEPHETYRADYSEDEANTLAREKGWVFRARWHQPPTGGAFGKSADLESKL